MSVMIKEALISGEYAWKHYSTLYPSTDASPLEHMDAVKGKLENTSPFNASGHPALAVPIGLVPSRENPSINLPTSMQIVGRYWDELKILKVAYAWEREVGNWKEF